MLFSYAFLEHIIRIRVAFVPITVDIPQILSTSLRYYRGFCPHSHRNTTVIIPITMVIITVTAITTIPISMSLVSKKHTIESLTLKSMQPILTFYNSKIN